MICGEQMFRSHITTGISLIKVFKIVLNHKYNITISKPVERLVIICILLMTHFHAKNITECCEDFLTSIEVKDLAL